MGPVSVSWPIAGPIFRNHALTVIAKRIEDKTASCIANEIENRIKMKIENRKANRRSNRIDNFFFWMNINQIKICYS